jgi:glycine cleavage system H protein
VLPEGSRSEPAKNFAENAQVSQFSNPFAQEHRMTTKFTSDHVWISVNGAVADGALATVGITVHAQDALGDIVFVELPEIGKRLAKGDVAGVVESVKAAADVYMPLDGEVVEVNEALRSDPALANTDPLQTGWFCKVNLQSASQFEALMDEVAYQAFSKDA